ncbi:hypothetical protein AB6N23_14245 [Cellulomonas sp. 179-A 9B4 NHS]|uniref:hypothetical protein n=1 Tax=Cellulomonas sp. 179-A 9B4 NHS TaxID=3142379 RepID=UPI0039A2A43F
MGPRRVRARERTFSAGAGRPRVRAPRRPTKLELRREEAALRSRARTWGAVLVLPVALTVMAAGIARSDGADTALARDLQADGVRVTVTEVQVHDACTGRGCFGHDEVRVRLDGALRTLRGIEASFGDVPEDSG